MWIAYLALENRHGTPEKVNSILSRALGNCDGSKVYQRLACDVYEKNGQLDVTTNLTNCMKRNLRNLIFVQRTPMPHLHY